MKGLLLKEWYMMKKYCKSYLIVAAVFLAVALSGGKGPFAFFPCLLCGMIPLNLQGYDEQSGWIHYSGTLPYTKAQLVSVKYLDGLFSLMAFLAAANIIQIIKMSLNPDSASGDSFITFELISVFAFACFSVCLPFVFKFGIEKGRIIYFAVIAVLFAGFAVFSQSFTGITENDFAPKPILISLPAAGAVIYALSWCLSVALYKKREL